MLATSGMGWLDAAVIFLTVVPIGGFLWFARWFLKRDDDGKPQ